MRTMLAGVVFAVVVFLCQGVSFAHEMKSVYMEDKDGSSVLLDGDRVHVEALVQAFGQKGFEKKSKEPKEASCTVDAFALLLTAGVPERGIAVTCGRGTDLDIGAHDPDYIRKVAEHILGYIAYVRSPFVEAYSKRSYEPDWVFLGGSDEASKINSCVRISRKDWGSSRLDGYNRESQEKFEALVAVLRDAGYTARPAMATLCRGIVFHLACFVEMDDMEDIQMHASPSTRVQCSRNGNGGGKLTELLKVNNDIRGEGYVPSIVQAIQAGIESLTKHQ